MNSKPLRATAVAGLLALSTLAALPARAQINADTRSRVGVGGENGVNVGVGAGAGVGRNGINVGVNAGVGGGHKPPRHVHHDAPRYDDGRHYDRPHPVRDLVGGTLQGTAGIVSGAAGIATGTLSAVGDALSGGREREREDYERRDYRQEHEYRDPREYREAPNGISVDTNVNIHLGDH